MSSWRYNLSNSYPWTFYNVNHILFFRNVLPGMDPSATALAATASETTLAMMTTIATRTTMAMKTTMAMAATAAVEKVEKIRVYFYFHLDNLLRKGRKNEVKNQGETSNNVIVIKHPQHKPVVKWDRWGPQTLSPYLSAQFCWNVFPPSRLPMFIDHLFSPPQQLVPVRKSRMAGYKYCTYE
jgi:hypothetical protein